MERQLKKTKRYGNDLKIQQVEEYMNIYKYITFCETNHPPKTRILGETLERVRTSIRLGTTAIDDSHAFSAPQRSDRGAFSSTGDRNRGSFTVSFRLRLFPSFSEVVSIIF
ncbi:hypothetical protein ILYODFUR_037173 [Ilyodon furcidens]|uniref:Uncharacterized protein n=1 Tax=Ilyodon furcidens TaxID=33524 RepID=A0ABV0VK84_9TELE